MEDVAAGQFVQKRVEQVQQVAFNWLTKIESSSPLVRKSIETLDKQTAWLSRPLVSKLAVYGQPVVNKLDTTLSAAYCTVDANFIQPSYKLRADSKNENGEVSLKKVGENIKSTVVASSWFKNVDDALRPLVDKRSQEFAAFYDAATHTFQSLRQNAQSVKFEDFKEGLRDRLHLDERLSAVAFDFFSNVQARLRGVDVSVKVNVDRVVESVKPAIVEAWEHNAAAVTARTVYNTSVEYYRSNKHVPVAQQVEAMKTVLGHLWTDRLSQPLRELFENAKKAAASDCHWERLYDYTSSTVDAILPGDATNDASKQSDSSAQQSSNTRTVSTIVARVSKRLRCRAASQWSAVKDLSATRLKDIIHVDLIAYAETMIDQLDDAYHPVERVQQVHSSCSKTLQSTTKVALDTAHHASDNVCARLMELRTKLSVALERVKTAFAPILASEGGKQAVELRKDFVLLWSKTLHWQQSQADVAKLREDLSVLSRTLLAALNTWRQVQKLGSGERSITVN